MTTTLFSSVRDALDELARLVAAAQSADPFFPVTILVPSHASGMDIRNFLGRNLGVGTAAVRAFTLKDLATELITTSPAIRGRKPLPAILRQGAISKALFDQPGIFREVAEEPATARAIARTAVLLDSARPQASAELPALVTEVLRIHGTAAEHLRAHWYTDHEAYRIAGEALENAAIQRRLGTIIGFMLGAELQPQSLEFRRLLNSAGLRTIEATGAPDRAAAYLTASDADDEVRAVVRLVVDKLADGTPGHRIGIFHSVSTPYGALLTQRLTQAGVTFVGPAAHTLFDAPLARGLLRLLELDTEEPDTRTILDVLAEGTLYSRDHELPSSAQCERLHINPPQDDDQRVDKDDPRRARDLQNLALLNGFIDALTHHIDEAMTATTWTETAARLTSLIDQLMAPRASSERPEKAAAREKLFQIIQDLRYLDGIAPSPSPALVKGALEDAISAKGGWEGKSGTGVVVGGYPDAVGRDLDAVFFLGAAEGMAPRRIRENPLLPDDVCTQLGNHLPTVEQRAAASRDQFHAALATGTHLTITRPRGDLRGSGNYQPSRWITIDPTQELRSFAHGIETTAPTALAPPPTAQEWRLRHCLASGGAVALHNDFALQRAVAVTRDRRNGVFSRFNGNLSAHAGTIIDQNKALSPTRLEDWVVSPFNYFLRQVLKVNILEDPEQEVQISRMERGNLVHKILENYVRETKGGHAPSFSRLMELAEIAFAEFANPAWLDHAWERDKAAIRQDLLTVLKLDQETADRGWRYHAEEASFGPEERDTYPAVELQLDDGTTARFRGKVDRIDMHNDGGIRVIDYKTGKADSYKNLGPDDPTAGGTRFQLPVYGLFARSLAELPSTDVTADYWFISPRGGFKTIGYPVSEQVVEQLRADAGLIILALRNGIFPPKPEEVMHLSRYTTVTTFTTLMGQLALDLHWLNLQDAEELAPYAKLLKAGS